MTLTRRTVSPPAAAEAAAAAAGMVATKRTTMHRIYFNVFRRVSLTEKYFRENTPNYFS